MSHGLRATTSDKQECHQGFLGRLGRKEGRREGGKEGKKKGGREGRKEGGQKEGRRGRKGGRKPGRTHAIGSYHRPGTVPRALHVSSP